MTHYTDDDVIAGTQAAIAHYKAERGITGNTYMWEGMEPQVRAILDAVAPAIAARALRDFADNHVGLQTPGPGALIAGMGVDGFIGMVIDDAARYRRESEDDYAADTDRLEERAKAAEAALARVEATVEALDLLRTGGTIPHGIGMGWRGGVEIATANLHEALRGPDAEAAS